MAETCAGREQPLISLIIPMYKTAVYLPDCLDSVLAQTYRNLEILLVDDASPDGCAAIAGAYAAKDPRFVYIHRENGGLSAARNTGLDAAKGDWIAFLDSDDLLPPRALEMLLTAALENDTAMAMGAYVECHAAMPLPFNRPVGAKAGVWRGGEAIQRYFLTDGQFLCHMWTKLFRRDLFSTLRFPEGKIYEDNFLLPHLLEAAGSIAVINRPVYRYQVRGGSITTQNNIRRQMDGLEARVAYTAFIEAHYPQLTPLAHDVTLSFASNLLGRMEHLGVAQCPEEWDEVTTLVRSILPQAALQNLMYRALAAAFRHDPHLLGRFVRMLLRVDQMI